ncbi:MAG TPA: DUF1844 domain-containing protein [Pyrinomonadaceae bacterium]|jgi:hypothetical protein|nr:DUF1844 domain-containing protein [Pyrinomonadaceae bacterium]
MIGKDENDEEVSYKVADRRKFNADGSVREGVTLDAAPPPKPREEKKAAPEPATRTHQSSELDSDVPPGDLTDEELAEMDDVSDIPGARDPASFVNFLSTLATNAAAALGAVPHPVTGKRSLDLETGKYWLDVLAMLKEKTNGNLHPQEQRLVDGLLGDLRMQYVQLVRATEEKLKAQAAAKFSGEDILGKK